MAVNEQETMPERRKSRPGNATSLPLQDESAAMSRETAREKYPEEMSQSS
jgi:hypothetical protein